jgi:hypothetical protein
MVVPPDRRPSGHVLVRVGAVAEIVRSRRLPSGTRVPGILEGVSVGGCLFRPYAPLELGDLVRVDVAGEAIEAVVLERTAGVYSCRFSDPTTALIEAAVHASLPHAA